MTEFSYKPLDQDEFRLLHVEFDGDVPLWSLRTHNFNTTTEFDTLSYTWGNLDETFPFVCDLQTLQIHQNLHTALPFLARRSSSLPIWIDAVCINQDDDSEKLVQIARMGDIYRHATQVWIWLGTPSAGTLEAMALLPKLKAVQDHLDSIPSPVHVPIGGLGLPTFSRRTWEGVTQLIDGEWFYRLWVVQEAVLAKNLKALCGSYEIEWDSLANARSCVDAFLIWMSMSGPGWNREEMSRIVLWERQGDIFSIRQASLGLQHDEQIEFTRLLLGHLCFGSIHCRDPQDRVLGVLALLPAGRVLDALTHKALPAVDLYILFSEQLVFHDDYKRARKDILLDFIYYATYLERISGLPSWVPYFHGAPRRGFDNIDQHNQMATLKASTRAFSLWRGAKPGQLVLKALCFDIIQDVYPKIPEGFPLEAVQTLLAIAKWEREISASIFALSQRSAIGGWANEDGGDENEWEDEDEENPWEDEEYENCREIQDEETSQEDIENGLKDGRLDEEMYWKTLVGHDYNLSQGDGAFTLEGLRAFRQYAEYVERIANLDRHQNVPEEPKCAHLGKVFFATAASNLQGRRLFFTAKGRLGIGLDGVSPGDVLCLINGAHVPHVMRQARPTEQEYVAVSEAYVYGMMNGEVEELGLPEEDITLI